MRSIVVAAMALTLAPSEYVFACDGSGGQRYADKQCGPAFANSPNVNQPFYNAAAANYQMNAMRQESMARAAAYNAKMYPIRLANATKAREAKLAKRQASTKIRLAAAEAKQRAKLEFEANSRTWIDASGQYEVRAIFIKANDRAVQLKKADGKLVNVPLEKLRLVDREYVFTKLLLQHQADEVLLASLWP
jgi:SLA1 homology domain 1, SHD1